MDKLRSGKDYWDKRNVKSPAQGSAFRLLYLFLLGDFQSHIKDSMAYNAALFVIYHPGIFECRRRKFVRDAYEERFDVSVNQIRHLDRRVIIPPSPAYSEE